MLRTDNCVELDVERGRVTGGDLLGSWCPGHALDPDSGVCGVERSKRTSRTADLCHVSVWTRKNGVTRTSMRTSLARKRIFGVIQGVQSAESSREKGAIQVQ